MATARSVVTVAPILEKLGLNLPAVLMNGVSICTLRSNEVHSFEPIEKEVAKNIIAAFLENNRPPFVFSLHNNEIEVEYKELKNAVDKEFYDDRVKRYFSFKQVDEFDLNKNIIYINATDHEEVIKPVEHSIKKLQNVSSVMYKDTYTNYWFIECFSNKASKILGAKKLQELTGADRIVAFGDNQNDMGMLAGADVAVAVENAIDELKKIADVITLSNENDGVAEYILKDFKE